jgi:hypothetical protein
MNLFLRLHEGLNPLLPLHVCMILLHLLLMMVMLPLHFLFLLQILLQRLQMTKTQPISLLIMPTLATLCVLQFLIDDVHLILQETKNHKLP